MEKPQKKEKTFSSASRVSKNTALNFMAKVMELAAGVVVIPLAARYLGLEAFGEYAFLGAVALVLGPSIAMGTLRILIRDMSVQKDKIPLMLTTGLNINGIMTVVVAVIAVILIFAFDLTSAGAITALYLALFGQVFKSMKNTVDSVFIAHERMKYIFITTIIGKALYIILLLAAIYLDYGITGLFASLAISNLLTLAVTLSISSAKFAKPVWNVDTGQIRYLFKEALPVAISVFIMQGFTYTNVFLLKIFQDNTHVSLFQGPQRVITPLFLLPASFLMAFVPTLSRLGSDKDEHEGLMYVYTKMMKYILIITLPVAIYLTTASEWVVGLLFGSEFSDATISFQLIIWTIIPLFANVLLSFLLTSIRQQRVLTISSLICFITNIVLALFLVPRYGHIGASTSYMAASYVLLVVNFFYATKYIDLIPFQSFIKQPLFASLIIFIMLFLLANKLNMIVLAIGVFLLYVGLLYVSKTFPPDEIEIFKSAFSKKPPRH